jgi:hypothetical protein
MGLAPIGHTVSVVSVRGVVINVSANFMLANGWTLSEMRGDLEDVVAGYIREIASLWDANDELVVRASQIESRLLNESGGRVIDISALSLNGGAAGRNVVLTVHEIPIRGTVTSIE